MTNQGMTKQGEKRNSNFHKFHNDKYLTDATKKKKTNKQTNKQQQKSKQKPSSKNLIARHTYLNLYRTSSSPFTCIAWFVMSMSSGSSRIFFSTCWSFDFSIIGQSIVTVPCE
jgi:hypothetical protein